MQPVIRALHVLRTVAASDRGLSLQELSQSLDVPMASMHRLLAVLTAEQFTARSLTSRRYFLGPAALDLSSKNRLGAGQLVTPHSELRKLADATGETVFVTELQGSRATCVALVDGQHPLRLFVHVGEEMPLHAAASARVLLSDLTKEEVVAMLEQRPLTPFTNATPRTVAEVLDQLALVRSRGYDVCDSELDKGVWAVAAPVRQSNGRVCATVTLAAPADRLATDEDRCQSTQAVVATADRIAADLGWTSPAR